MHRNISVEAVERIIERELQQHLSPRSAELAHRCAAGALNRVLDHVRAVAEPEAKAEGLAEFVKQAGGFPTGILAVPGLEVCSTCDGQGFVDCSCHGGTNSRLCPMGLEAPCPTCNGGAP